MIKKLGKPKENRHNAKVEWIAELDDLPLAILHEEMPEKKGQKPHRRLEFQAKTFPTYHFR